MPRIPVRTTPYHTLPRCTRHYKSKRDLILRALGKASFINGSQFVIAWISPKGEADVYASELLQSAVSVKDGGVLGRKELEREAVRVRGEMGRRWEDIRRLEEKGEAPVLEGEEGGEAVEAEGEEDEEGHDDFDPDRTMVEDVTFDIARQFKQQLPNTMMSTFPAAATRASTPTPPPMHALTLAPDAIDNYYSSRFAALQQATCKLVVKAWIKVIEPKKQMKFPYNKGEDLKPVWWPEGVRHREPDHLSKTGELKLGALSDSLERLTLLSSIVRSPLITVSRLELSTAEAAAFISRPRLAILREVYLVAKEEEKRRKEGDMTSDLVVHLPYLPVSPSTVSPEGGIPGKRPYAFDQTDNKENVMAPSVFLAHQQKRVKHTHPHTARLAPLTATHQPNFYEQQFYSTAPTWRDANGQPSIAPPHLSPYPSELGFSGSEYVRSPNPDYAQHAGHLGPLLTHSQSQHSHSPADSPAFPPTASLVPPTAASASSAYYFRTPNGQSHMQQQQVEYLQAHGHGFDYGSPYLADSGWDAGFAQTA